MRRRAWWAWARRHERKLWWAFLAASIIGGFARNPGCASATPWWAWVAPLVLFVLMWAWLAWSHRRLMRSLRSDSR